MPGHGNLNALMSRIDLSLTLWVPTASIHPEGECFVIISVWHGDIVPSGVVCKITREHIFASLMF